MSDVLIKRMEMPKSCSDCKIRLPVGCCGNLPQNTRMPNCPLVSVPPHGRLIDADALYEMCVLDTNTDVMASTKRINEYMQLKIDDAPTIIEAEEGE